MPLYLKVFEVLFFAVFLVLYYIVLVQKHAEGVTAAEVMLYFWLASFAYNGERVARNGWSINADDVVELGEFWDAGSAFYATDFWSLWDLGIIFVGAAFFVARMIGHAQHDHPATEVAFDILSVEALFLVPRYQDTSAKVPTSQVLTQRQDLLVVEPSSLLWDAHSRAEGNGQ